MHRRARAAPVALARAVLRDSTGRPLSTNIIVRVTPQAASRPQSSWGRGRGRRRRASAPDSNPSALPWPGSQLLVLSTARRHLDVLNNLCTRKRAARAQSWERARSAPGSSASPCSSPAGTDVAPLRLPELEPAAAGRRRRGTEAKKKVGRTDGGRASTLKGCCARFSKFRLLARYAVSAHSYGAPFYSGPTL